MRNTGRTAEGKKIKAETEADIERKEQLALEEAEKIQIKEKALKKDLAEKKKQEDANKANAKEASEIAGFKIFKTSHRSALDSDKVVVDFLNNLGKPVTFLKIIVSGQGRTVIYRI